MCRQAAWQAEGAGPGSGDLCAFWAKPNNRIAVCPTARQAFISAPQPPSGGVWGLPEGTVSRSTCRLWAVVEGKLWLSQTHPLPTVAPALTQAHLPCPRQPLPVLGPCPPIHFESSLLDAILFLRCGTNFATPCSELSHGPRCPQGRVRPLSRCRVYESVQLSLLCMLCCPPSSPKV